MDMSLLVWLYITHTDTEQEGFKIVGWQLVFTEVLFKIKLVVLTTILWSSSHYKYSSLELNACIYIISWND